ncbi:AEC family transporter [Marinimicrococcus flavescens]|uniref:AEC family transporter n=1 Tax=Marinimicrococcus flavescens TaxID=3031815 RepID=A0AAP3UZ01_9PROT|nr:AEC family transporter [Marinimicrococcus flavescens]
MGILLDIVIPVFGLVGFGYAATFTRQFDERAARGLAVFVFQFALPVMLFRNMAVAELPQSAGAGLLLAYYAGTALVLATAILAARLLPGAVPGRAAILGFGSAYGNTVLLGIPLAITALGPEAGPPLYLIIAFHGMSFFTVITVLLELSRGTRENLRGLPLRTLKGLATNVILVSIVSGLLWQLLAGSLPPVIDRWAELIGRAALPCALFSMGASLRSYRIAGALGPALYVVLAKLVVHPLVVALFVLVLVPLPPLWAQVAIISAALPVGVNVYLFAGRYGVGEAETATAILLSTLLGVVSLSVVLALLGLGTR